MNEHPDFEQEQATIDHAYACLEAAREAANRLHQMVEVGAGGTHQARYERDVITEKVANRLAQLEIGDLSLCFGRIDFAETDHDLTEGGDSFHIGRVAVWDPQQDPVLIDWRAPAAEPFYRATGREPLGLVRRRHFATRGRSLLGIEDEFFGDAAYGDPRELKGRGTLVSALESARTGRLGDIVATIQTEQDEIIRGELPGAIVVQGGPGTGKTVVALHRAAYLLYTHRFPLEGQGLLLIGPNRVFLTYIEQVLPSLGEAGVELATLGDLLGQVRVRGFDAEPVARIKGDLRMADVIARAVRDRERPLRDDLVIGYGLRRLRLTVADSRDIVVAARRRSRNHNNARSAVEDMFYERLAASARDDVDPIEVRERLHGTLETREALDWMWPVLTPAHLVHDLFGSKPLLRSAGREGLLSQVEVDHLHRSRSGHASDVIWTQHDAPVLDEARSVLGPRPRRKTTDEVRTYGHIVIDEAQDLSPMQLRMIERRSLNGSMTIVGDIAQATGAWPHDDWDEVLAHLHPKRDPRLAELTVGYRLPGPTIAVAARVLAQAAPGLKPPVAVRDEGDEPRFVSVDDPAGRAEAVIEAVREEVEAIGSGNVAVIAPDSLTDELSAALETAGIDHGAAYRGALERQVTVVPIGLVKGLELDASIVVEPTRIVAEQPQGLRALYVAVTRATKRLTIVHAEGLPDALR